MDTPKAPRKDIFQRIGAYALLHPRRILFFFIVFVFFFIGLQFLINIVFTHKKEDSYPSVALTLSRFENVPVYFSAIGTVMPNFVITVKTQINGTLTEVDFQDGQFVKAGDILAKIDSRVYQAQMLQYQGAMLRDQALLENAKRDLTRYENLYKQKAVSEQTLTTQATLVKQYEGTVKIDQGQYNAAQTNFSYCTITSPVTGRIGISTVDAGNFVQTSDTTGIAVITTLSPISVLFPLPEKDVGQTVEAFTHYRNVPVTVFDQNRKNVIAMGKLTAIDNQVNTSTGTVNFKAGFLNENNALFPNAFVNVKMQVATLPNAIVIPTAAIQEGNEGAYVYRYNQNHTVTYLPIKTGVTYGEDTVVLSGLSVNMPVVVQGADKLFDGAIVQNSGTAAP